MKQRIKESIVPLTTFRRQSAEVIKKVQEHGLPIILTQNGNAAAVLINPDAYDELVESAEKSLNTEIGAAIARSRNVATRNNVHEHE